MDITNLTKVPPKSKRGTFSYVDFSGETIAKECSKCNSIKNITDYPKTRNTCKECIKAYQVKYRSDNNDRLLSDKRKYYEENRQQFAAKNKKYYEENTDYRLAYLQKYREENSEQITKRRKDYYEANKETVLGRAGEWRRKNPERWSMYGKRRRARKQSLPDTFTFDQHNETSAKFNGGCALTGSDVIHWDHVVPLATGLVGTIHGNMIPLRADLNISKRDANLFEWFKTNKERFELSQEKFDSLVDWLSDINGMSVSEYKDYVYECHNATELKACK